jgi:hypothetical protein
VVTLIFDNVAGSDNTPGSDNAARVWDSATGKPLGEPLRHKGGVVSAIFSPDDARIVTASRDGTARVWEIATTEMRRRIAHDSSKVLVWARAIAGLRFNDDGELEVIPDDDRRKILHVTQLPPGPWADLAAWQQTSGPEATLSPNSKVTFRQVAENERDFNSIESLKSALDYDPTVPLARMMLANLLEKKEPAKAEGERDAAVLARAAHWRRYDLDRLPNDPKLRARAAEILMELPDAKVGVGPKPSTAAEAARALTDAMPDSEKPAENTRQ